MTASCPEPADSRSRQRERHTPPTCGHCDCECDPHRPRTQPQQTHPHSPQPATRPSSALPCLLAKPRAKGTGGAPRATEGVKRTNGNERETWGPAARTGGKQVTERSAPSAIAANRQRRRRQSQRRRPKERERQSTRTRRVACRARRRRRGSQRRQQPVVVVVAVAVAVRAADPSPSSSARVMMAAADDRRGAEHSTSRPVRRPRSQPLACHCARVRRRPRTSAAPARRRAARAVRPPACGGPRV